LQKKVQDDASGVTQWFDDEKVKSVTDCATRLHENPWEGTPLPNIFGMWKR